MGGFLSRGENRRALVKDLEPNSHKLPELFAAALAIKSFAKAKESIHIHLMMDNTTALTYINKYGGTASPELSRLAKDCGCRGI